MIRLNGSAASPVSGSVAYLWEQIDGPKVALLNATSPNAAFVVPRGISDDSTLKFKFTVMDGSQRSENTTYVKLIAGSSLLSSGAGTGSILSSISSPTVLIATGGSAAAVATVGVLAAKGSASNNAFKMFRRPKFPILKWNVYLPRSIQSGGTSYVDVIVRNVGEADARNLVLSVDCLELRCDPPSVIESIMPWETRKVSFAVNDSLLSESLSEYNIKVALQTNFKPGKEAVSVIEGSVVRWNPRKEISATLGTVVTRVGILCPYCDGQLYSEALKTLKKWLESRGYRSEDIEPAQVGKKWLENIDVVIIPSADSSVPDQASSLLDQVLQSGKGVIVVGLAKVLQVLSQGNSTVSEAKSSPTGPQEVIDVAWSFGVRLVDSVHPISRGLRAGSIIRTSTNLGFPAISSAPPGWIVIAEQLVSKVPDHSIVNLETIPAVLARVIPLANSQGGDTKTARVVWFNMDNNAYSEALSGVTGRAIQWAGGILQEEDAKQSDA